MSKHLLISVKLSTVYYCLLQEKLNLFIPCNVYLREIKLLPSPQKRTCTLDKFNAQVTICVNIR